LARIPKEGLKGSLGVVLGMEVGVGTVGDRGIFLRDVHADLKANPRFLIKTLNQ
jgi:hypothetical protein